MADKQNQIPSYLLRPQAQVAGQNLGYKKEGYGRTIAEKTKAQNKEKTKLVTKGVRQAVSNEVSKYNTIQQKNQRLIKKHGVGYDPDRVRSQQRELIAAGYNLGPTGVDGDWGPISEQKWREYQAKKKHPQQSSKSNFVGFQIPSTPVDRLGNKTEECATFSNTWMRNNGIDAGGDAYQVGRRYSPVINGYDGIDFQKGVSNKQIMDYHRQAADKVQQDLDTLSLQKGHMYPVNMYYNTSPHMQEFYNKSLDENTKTPGTHTGVLYYDGNQWMVGHNIHGTILNNPVAEVLGGKSNPHKYGITAVYDAGATKQYPDKEQNKLLKFLGI